MNMVRPNIRVKKPTVFISYAREDLDKALELYKNLEKAGCDPWIDKEKLPPGIKWKTAIKQAIKECDFFLACLSKKSVSKVGFFQTELKEAYEILKLYPSQNIYLIPVLLEDCDIPQELQEYNCLNLFGTDSFAKLLKAILEEWGYRGFKLPKKEKPMEQLPVVDEYEIKVLLSGLMDKDWQIQYSSAIALGKMGVKEPLAIEILLKGLKDANDKVRVSSASVLGEMGVKDNRVIDALLESLRHEDWNTRGSSANALGKLGVKKNRVIEALLQGLEDVSPSVRASSTRALGELGGKSKRIIDALMEGAAKAEAGLMFGDWVEHFAFIMALDRLGVEDDRVTRAKEYYEKKAKGEFQDF